MAIKKFNCCSGDVRRVYSEVDGMECCLAYKSYNAGFCKILTHPRWYVSPHKLAFFLPMIYKFYSKTAEGPNHLDEFFCTVWQGKRSLSSNNFCIRTTKFCAGLVERVSFIRRGSKVIRKHSPYVCS